MSYKCPRCGLVYEKEEKCPLCDWPIDVPFKPDEPIHRGVPKINCPECGKEMERGTLQIQGEPYSFIEYGIRWFSMDEKLPQGLVSELIHFFRIRKPGAYCRDCGLIILRWENLMIPNEKTDKTK